MTPGTNIGAGAPGAAGRHAHSGKRARRRTTSWRGRSHDAVAYLQAIAGRRGRNVAWAAEVVSKSTSIVSGLAVREHVVDLEADSSRPSRKVDGRELPDFKGTLRTKARDLALRDDRPPEASGRGLGPQHRHDLMTLGVSGLLIELYSPGLILPGIVG